MTDIRLNDVGRIFVGGSGGYDLSGQTTLRMVFKKPDGTVVEKTGSDGVIIVNAPITVDVQGVPTTFEANEYWQYPSEAGLLDQVGTTWSVHGEYVDATPKDLSGDVHIFEVLPRE